MVGTIGAATGVGATRFATGEFVLFFLNGKTQFGPLLVFKALITFLYCFFTPMYNNIHIVEQAS